MASDLALLASDPTPLERAADPGEFVVLACERAKQWLAEALNNGNIDQIVELKSQAEAIRIYSAQKQLGKDAELSAAEIVRRAERGIGLSIRRGQEEGTIRRQYQHEGNQYTAENGETRDAASSTLPPSPTSLGVGKHELAGNGGRNPGIYALTDNVPDDSFEAAVTEAKAEGNLSRANVVRKARGEGTPKGPKNEWHAHRVDLDPNRIVREALLTLEGAASGLRLAENDQLQIEDWWLESLAASMTQFRALQRTLKGLTP